VLLETSRAAGMRACVSRFRRSSRIAKALPAST
jgi:hypothetical protein